MAFSPRSFSERVRRNHALEHATLHVLAREMPHLSLVGRSDGQGFALYGEVDTESVRHAAAEAYERLRAGETYLAVHPNCGTNMAVGMLLAAGALALSLLSSRRSKAPRWPLAVLGVAGALTLSVPLGPEVQRRWTTYPDMDGVTVTEVVCVRRGKLPVHRVRIEHSV
jgi:hypothetical protein